ncbi:MAG: DUF3306 domain-containing protein [Arenicellales bacterium]|nr:DUF3306 domain-containing protein [Arenicellales bacterium]
MNESKPGFYSRWSQRKSKAVEVVDAGQEQDSGSQEDAPKPEAASDTPPPTDADMPPLESLSEESDYSDFLSPGVSDKLRKVALRKLFHGSGYNLRDGLDDYDDDFTVFEALGDVVTADMRHRQEMLERKARETQAAGEEKTEIAVETPVDESPGAAAKEQQEQLPQEQVATAATEQGPGPGEAAALQEAIEVTAPGPGSPVEKEQEAQPEKGSENSTKGRANT